MRLKNWVISPILSARYTRNTCTKDESTCSLGRIQFQHAGLAWPTSTICKMKHVLPYHHLSSTTHQHEFTRLQLKWLHPHEILPQCSQSRNAPNSANHPIPRVWTVSGFHVRNSSWQIWILLLRQNWRPLPKQEMGVSKNSGTPKWIMENPIKMDDLGAPLFLETPKSSANFLEQLGAT